MDKKESVPSSTLTRELFKAWDCLAPTLNKKYTTKNILRAALSVAIIVLGAGAIYNLPWYLWFMGWIASGTALYNLSLVAVNCSHLWFSSRHRLLNHAVGWICTIPLLLPFESWKEIELTGSKSRSLTGRIASSRLWFASSVVECLSSAVNCFNTPQKKRVYFNLALLYAAAASLFPTLIYYCGLWAVTKYYIMPLLVYHLWRASTIRIRYTGQTIHMTVMEDSAVVALAAEVKRRFPEKALCEGDISHLVGEYVSHLASLDSKKAPLSTRVFKALFGWEAISETPAIGERAVRALEEKDVFVRRRSRSHGLRARPGSDQGIVVPVKSYDPTTSAWDRPFHYFNIVYMSTCHILALYGCYLAPDASRYTWMAFGAFYAICVIGITAGSHRLWAHKAYQASRPLEFVLMLFSTIANEGSVLRWARDHRLHHRASDTDLDPHNASRGFFYSHMGWLFVEKSKECTAAGRTIPCDDLYGNPLIAWQHRNYRWFAPVMCHLVPALVAMTWGEGYVGLFLLGFTRYVVVLHVTWCINSLAHFIGYRPYVLSILPVENPVLSIFSFGEGWHNYHHSFPHDYSANEYGALQINPSTAFIDAMAFLGLAWGRKRAQLASPADVDKNQFTWEDVRVAASQGAHLIVIKDKVYDVATFHDGHPGGATILKSYYGKDATAAFYNGAKHTHTDAARHLMSTLQVGVLCDPGAKKNK